MNTAELVRLSPVIPVVTLEDPAAAVPTARALAEGGVRVIELTLRTDSALESLRRIVAEVPEITAGAGTVLNPRQASAAVEAGAQFLVSPGLTRALTRWIAEASDVPFLPGVSDLGQVMEARDHGLTELKFFPAEAAGGAAYLKAVAGPVQDVVFCPTGGVSPQNAPGYLALPNVACVGGTWLTPAELVQAGRYEEITGRAREASRLSA